VRDEMPEAPPNMPHALTVLVDLEFGSCDFFVLQRTYLVALRLLHRRQHTGAGPILLSG
jgi:hypothetical protein